MELGDRMENYLPGDIELRFEADKDSKIFVVTLLVHYPVIVIQT